jgi:hypothetical protein
MMKTMEIQLSMLGLIVRDMGTALRFYRLLGLDIPASDDGKPFVLHRVGSGVSIFFDTVFAARYDPQYTPRAGTGYGSPFEFYLGDDSAVDAKYAELTAARIFARGMPRRMAKCASKQTTRAIPAGRSSALPISVTHSAPGAADVAHPAINVARVRCCTRGTTPAEE